MTDAFSLALLEVDNLTPALVVVDVCSKAAGVRLLGVEPPSVADVNNLAEVTLIHRILLGSEIVIVEGLTNLDTIAHNRVLFCAAPLKIAGGDGSPCRAFAIDDDA